MCERGYDPKQNAFVQSFGDATMDASLLLIPIVGFLPPDDPRVQGTVAAIESKLVRDGLVMRYDTGSAVDGLPPGEGAFLACSFWLVDNYVLLGRYDDASALFERLLALRNDVGLLAEEYDPHSRRQLGNFPQAFSHLALINAAHSLSTGAGAARLRSAKIPARSAGVRGRCARNVAENTRTEPAVLASAFRRQRVPFAPKWIVSRGGCSGRRALTPSGGGAGLVG